MSQSKPTFWTRELSRRVAAWLFVLPFFFGYARPGGSSDAQHLYLFTGESALALLAILLIFTLHAGVPRRAAATVTTSVVACSTVVIVYAFLWQWLRGNAPADPAIHLAISAGVYFIVTICYAQCLYEAEVLMETFLKVGRVALVVALLAYAAKDMTGGWLVHRQYGSPRLEGFLSEPSGWSAALPALLLLSWHRSRYGTCVLAIVALVLTKSPTVTLAAAISISIYVLLSGRFRRFRKEAAVLLLSIWGFAYFWFENISINEPTSDADATYFDQVFGRLASGVSRVASDGAVGRNDRYNSTQAVIDQLRDHGWLFTGIGPGVEGYILNSTGLLPNALPIYVLGSFGVIGLLLFGIVFVKALLVSRNQLSYALFLPFLIASTINSAGGWEFYKFAVLVIFTSAPFFRRYRRLDRQVVGVRQDQLSTGCTSSGTLSPPNP